MKTFITPCFIRKNTPELREKLEELGYTEMFNAGNSNHYDCILCLMSGYTVLDESDPKNLFDLNNTDYIDCSTNKPLFLAISALTEDSDEGQWFTDGKDWIQSERDDWIDNISVLCCGGNYNYDKNGELSKNFHKATVEELIEQFKEEKKRV